MFTDSKGEKWFSWNEVQEVLAIDRLTLIRRMENLPVHIASIRRYGGQWPYAGKGYGNFKTNRVFPKIAAKINCAIGNFSDTPAPFSIFAAIDFFPAAPDFFEIPFMVFSSIPEFLLLASVWGSSGQDGMCVTHCTSCPAPRFACRREKTKKPSGKWKGNCRKNEIAWKKSPRPIREIGECPQGKSCRSRRNLFPCG